MSEALQSPFRTLFPKAILTPRQEEDVEAITDAKRRIRKNGDTIEMVEVEATFSRYIPLSALARIEDDLREQYKLLSFRIIPHFPCESYSTARLSDVAEEATRIGALTKGFFSGATYLDDGHTVHVEIPYLAEGVALVNEGHTADLLSRILVAWFGVNRTFVIEASSDARQATDERQEEMDRLLREYEAQALRAEQAETRASQPAEGGGDEVSHLLHRRADCLYPDPPHAEAEGDGVFFFGHMRFDTKGAQPIFGDPIPLDEPTPIGRINAPAGQVTLIGEVYAVNVKELKNGEKLAVSVGMTDGVHSFQLRRTGTPEEFPWLGSVKAGKSLAASCRVFEDKFDGELVGSPTSLMLIKRILRTDDAPEKRTELHLHTTMSQMDAYITPKDLISTATRWGWRAVAVTDHGNVQAFPEVMLEKDRQKADDLKILYGMEAYFVNDKARAVWGTDRPALGDEMVVFDIETTGLDNRSCRITEIGAVKIKGGVVTDEFNTFVNPETPIPPEITKLTSITDEMVADAPKIGEALASFLAFVGDDLLIAHNANFDCGFIRAAAEECGYSFTNTYLDTVALSRYLNPQLKRHKLDVLVDHYGIGEFHHHRACDDARVLAHIYFRMEKQLEEEGIRDYRGMVDAMSERTDPKKLRPYHMILFAKNLTGLKNLYKLISASYLTYYKRFPRIPKSLLDEHREGLIVGSACEAGELYQALLDNMSESVIEEIADYYDYLEIQPLCNNRFLVREEKVADEEALRRLNRTVVALGDKLGKPVVATCDAHFLDREDELFRKIILKGQKFSDAEEDTGIYLRTTEEMLREFDYLGEDVARRVVIENPAKIADMCEDIRPIPLGRYEPKMEGAEEDLVNSCWQRARDWYGFDDGNGVKIPEIVSDRLTRELDAIISNGFAVLYMIAVKLVAYSEEQGYLVGSRGSVGSSFVASMSGISEVNPLPPHYRCPKCRYSAFYTDGSYGSGFDLPDANCPHCGTPLISDGHDIPFETFLGFKGDKSPDIDLNFSGEVQGRVHKFTEELFGEGNVYRAGTISTLADKTAFGYVMKYLDEHGVTLPRAEVDQLVSRVAGVKRTTGQHPGGIIVVPKENDIHDFTPVQHPADDPNSDIVTTHFQFSYLHDTILKLDELGHDIPTKYKMLERYTGTSVLDVKMNDPRVYRLFSSTEPLGITPDQIGGCKMGTYGIPEFGTHFLHTVLEDAKPKNFADLLQISGLTHGTNVWLGNAQDLIRAGVCDISKVIGTRDGIMLDLIRYGLSNSDAFVIMESVRKGRGLKPEWEENMRAHGVPDWYIGSCKKIKYMFPKAHAAAYVMSAIRLGWYKIEYPMEFYAAFLSVAPGGFDAEIVMQGKSNVRRVIEETAKKPQGDLTQKDKELIATLQLVEESMARGIKYLPPHLYKSDYRHFLPEDGKIRMPFTSLSGLGDTAAQKIVEVRDAGPIYSIEDLRVRAGVSKAVIDTLRKAHALDGLTETNQFTLF